eukprot:GSMAST32.ASY1.ANO1.741.1 assembled CDS
MGSHMRMVYKAVPSIVTKRTFHRSFASAATPSMQRTLPVNIQNSVTGMLEPLQCDDDGILRWYNCGPTVYDSAHLGHARTYVCLDIMQRILRDYFRQPVVSVMGITDVDDKIVARAKERSMSARELSRLYELEFLNDMRSLGVELPPNMTRVSEHIGDIQEYIQTIIDNGNAYILDSGVYFDTASIGNAYDQNELSEKKDFRDFALWKVIPEKKETNWDSCVTWDSKWGRGRPGWHIECSAMSHQVLGKTFNLHIRFHHEFQIYFESYLQCKPNCWVSQFVHTGHVCFIFFQIRFFFSYEILYLMNFLF